MGKLAMGAGEEVRTFFDWLLGPGWQESAAWHPLVLAVGLGAVVLVFWWLVAIRRGSVTAARRAGRLLAAAAVAPLVTGLLLLGVLLVGAIFTGAGFQAELVGLGERLQGFLAWGLGEGYTQGALYLWLLVMECALSVAVIVGWLAAALRGGPVAAFSAVDRTLTDGLLDILRISPRRVQALTWLTVKESIRRRVVVAFAVFIVILLFAPWFFVPGSDDPARLYLSRLPWLASMVVLLIALLLSALSLPLDIRSHTLQTVVTKPVRRSEIVLGKILGFSIVGTVLLAVIGAISYVFVIRGLAHTHELAEADLETAEKALSDAAGKPLKAPLSLRTSLVQGHRHTIQFDPTAPAEGAAQGPSALAPSGRLRTETENGHWHEFSYELQVDKSGERPKTKIKYRVGPPEGTLLARVPVYGKLRFKDRAGKDAEKGINTGDEWTYRSYFEGGTLAAAVWTFHNITEHDFPEGLPVELTIGVFRTHKGEIEKGVPGSLTVRNPKTGLTGRDRIFESKEYVTDVQFIPRELETPAGQPIDLFRDLVSDGEVEVWLRCVAPQQYFGVAQPDLYLRARDAPFYLNFAKTYLGIWLQMMLVIALGVVLSTFLSAPVALMATGFALVVGLNSELIARLAAHKVVGGGPLESFIRLMKQQNVVSELDPGLRSTLAQMIDKVLEFGMRVLWAILPDFDKLSFSDSEGRLYLALGFDISPALVVQCLVQAAAYWVPLAIAGYFFLKMREVGQ